MFKTGVWTCQSFPNSHAISTNIFKSMSYKFIKTNVAHLCSDMKQISVPLRNIF